MLSRVLPFFLLASTLGAAPAFHISTVAGVGTFAGDNGPATAALVSPTAVVAAPNGSLYVSDPINYRIRKIDSAGTITTVIGKGYGTFSGDGGPASAAEMSTAGALALDAAGDLFFTDDGNLRIREVTAAGMVNTVAGNGTCGTVTAGAAATSAALCDVEGVAVDPQGRVYFGSNSSVWMIGADGTLSLVAANMGLPDSIVIDQAGNIYVSDEVNFVISKITPDRQVSTVITINDVSATGIQLALDAGGTLFYVIGTRQVFKLVQGIATGAGAVADPNDATNIAVDASGAIYVSSVQTQRLLKISGGSTTTVAGAYPYDLDPLPAQAAAVHLQLNSILIGLAVDTQGNVYFPELDGDLHQRIDKVTPGGVISSVSTPATLPGGGAFRAHAIAIGPDSLIYFSTTAHVYRIEASGAITLIAGAPGFPTNVGDGGAATSARLQNPAGLTFDQSGNLYIADPFDSRIRKVTPQNIISTFAGTGQSGYAGDGGPANAARLGAPVDVKAGADGSIYIADLTSSTVRKVDTAGMITTVAGNGATGYSGDGGQAKQAQLTGAAAIALDAAGNLYIADRNQAAATFKPVLDSNRIRMVDTAGVITTIAGPTPGYNGENVLSQVAALGGPAALAVDADGALYVAEPYTQRVRKLTPMAASSIVITSVYTSGGYPDIAPNGWTEIKGINLAPADLGPGGMVWSNAPEFQQGRMPTRLGTVSVTINGKAAFIYFISAGQINVLAPLDTPAGPVQVVVTVGAASSAPFTATARAAAPSFLRLGDPRYIVATHADGVLLGPASFSVPGYPYRSAQPGEIVILYSVGFGLPDAALTSGSSSQFGVLAPQPVVKIAGIAAKVLYAGINGVPGLYQINVEVPAGTPDGDAAVSVEYGGTTSPAAAIVVQH